MPYIPEERRADLGVTARALGRKAHTSGELNFSLTTVVLAYLKELDDPSYRAFRGVIGDIECMKLELYRRLIVPYEDTKIEENGDVY